MSAGLLAFISLLCSYFPPVKPYVRGYFLSDSVVFGSPVEYALVAYYAPNQEVLFPDSTKHFTPFEWRGYRYVPTIRYDSLYLYDSAVYTLATFDTSLKQALRLPVVFFDGKDSLYQYTTYDTIYVSGIIDSVLSTSSPKAQLNYLNVETAFNYPYLFLGIGIGVCVLFMLYLFFGKSIRRRIACYRLKKRYEVFLHRFEAVASSAPSDPKAIENALLVWKQYMEHVGAIPYTRLTTKEILAQETDTSLEILLRFDQYMYGGLRPTDAENLWGRLLHIAEKKYLSAYKRLRMG